MSSAFHKLKIADVVRETPEAISVCFDLKEADKTAFTFQPGQHLTLRTFIEGEEVRRNYSICAAPSEGQLRIAIKAIPGGRFSNWEPKSQSGPQHRCNAASRRLHSRVCVQWCCALCFFRGRIRNNPCAVIVENSASCRRTQPRYAYLRKPRHWLDDLSGGAPESQE